MGNRYIVYGCGGHARSVADVILYNNPASELTFVDENALEGEEIFGFSVTKNITTETGEVEAFVAIGDNSRRANITLQIGRDILSRVISNDAHIGRDAQISEGCFIGHEAYIGPLAKISNSVIINTRAIIEHEVSIGQFSQIAPQVVIGGRVSIGENVFIGLGSIVIDGISICDNVIIGAGAVVVNDIDQPGTYVGVPARAIK